MRVIAQTSFEDDPDGVRVDGVLLKPPYVIDAIGNPDTLAGALDFQGGFIDDVEADDGVGVDEEGRPDQGHRHPHAGRSPATPNPSPGSSLPSAGHLSEALQQRGAACFPKT